ncbi:MAG: M17 family metallopeptidase, partial [Alphaproteobacteria bacterium]
TVPIEVIAAAGAGKWLAARPASIRAWLERTGFEAAPGNVALVPGADGRAAEAVFVESTDGGPWPWSALAAALPPGSYRMARALPAAKATDAALGWELAGYEFTRYRKPRGARRALVWPTGADRAMVGAAADAIAMVRDLINTPAEDMGPSELATAARSLARRHGARARVVAGGRLLEENYPAIHVVGRASDDAPRLIDLTWGRPGAPRVTLVGKGVCFDSGGLDLKSARAMQLMKKDMGGAAHALGLASMIMATGLAVRLRVLIGAVENTVAANAYKPLDVIGTRAGLTVEVRNTDAEGRLVLADCLAEASREKPALLIDFATLTGAARIALGTELPALFTRDDGLATALAAHGEATHDPVWRLPLHAPYRRRLDSQVADLASTGSDSYAGAITAALFLGEFVPSDVPWVHLDIMAWNTAGRPGRPEGGEAMGLRAAFALVAERFGGGAAKAPRKGRRRAPRR